MTTRPAVTAAGWDVDTNIRCGYRVDIPPGCARRQEANDGDGATFGTDDGLAAYFRTEYPQGHLKAFDPIIAHIVTSIRPSRGCNPAPATAPGASNVYSPALATQASTAE